MVLCVLLHYQVQSNMCQPAFALFPPTPHSISTDVKRQINLNPMNNIMIFQVYINYISIKMPWNRVFVLENVMLVSHQWGDTKLFEWCCLVCWISERVVVSSKCKCFFFWCVISLILESKPSKQLYLYFIHSENGTEKTNSMCSLEVYVKLIYYHDQ